MFAKSLHIVLIAISLPAISLGQFFGGDGDGSVFKETLSPVNDQAVYCSGGDADGYCDSTSGQVALNLQYFYCTAGEGDGYTASSVDTILNQQVFYCNGGESDGYFSIAWNTSLNDQTFYCLGGDADGNGSISSGIITLNDHTIYCSGGNNDGCNGAFVSTTLNEQYFYCYGSLRDGYDLNGISTTINDQYFYCNGGFRDGTSQDAIEGFIYGDPVFAYGGNEDGSVLSDYFGGVYGPSIFCIGGNSDGYNLAEATSLYLGIGLWTGLTNTSWNTATNWQHEIIPGVDDNVTIPSGCPNYPEITSTLVVDTTSYGSYYCNGLEIQPSASLNTTGPLHINGKMTLGGTYTATMNGNNANRIYGKGELTILPTGSALFGNQTSVSGITDLLVYDGGVLNVDGGTLHIDDQLHVYSGGTLNMTDGELWVHKFGYGTNYSSFNPANFYVEAGAQGGISGGALRICGRTSFYGLYSMTILEPTFDFSGTATVKFEHGTYGTHYDASINAVDGVILKNLIIDKPGNTVKVTTDLTVSGSLNVQPNSTLEVEDGNTLTVGP